MTTLPAAIPSAQPKCPPDFDRDYPGAERIDLDGFAVWVAVGWDSGGPGIRRGSYVEAISEPVLTDAQRFVDAYEVEATPENLALIAEHEETTIEAIAMRTRGNG